MEFPQPENTKLAAKGCVTRRFSETPLERHARNCLCARYVGAVDAGMRVFTNELQRLPDSVVLDITLGELPRDVEQYNPVRLPGETNHASDFVVLADNADGICLTAQPVSGVIDPEGNSLTEDGHQRVQRRFRPDATRLWTSHPGLMVA